MITSLLHYAVLCCSSEIVKNLLPRVQNVSSLSEWWYAFLGKEIPFTALWLAALQHDYSTMSLLLEAGASPYETCIG